jgi:uncharacterized protein involved in exopolysaccharide biosynthesis
LLKFTDKHPDVIAARSTLEDLKARREAEVERLRQGDAGAVAASGISSNPVYQQLQSQLNEADTDIISLQAQVGQHRAKATELRKRMDTAPKVEAEFAALNRDYDTIKAQYSALLTNQEKAVLGDRADEAGAVRFEYVEPPTAPYTTAFPQRFVLLGVVLLAALGVGGGLCYLLHLLNPVVSSLPALVELVDRPVLGVISAAFPQKGAARLRRQSWLFGGATAALFLACGGLVVLDSLGYRLYGVA